MSKPRMRVQLDDSTIEPYQWGNSDKGGCGAPLLDKGGQTLANLRKVIKDTESPRNNVDWRNDQSRNDMRGGNTDFGDRLDSADSIIRHRSGDDIGLEERRHNEAYMTKGSPSFNNESRHFGGQNNGSNSDGSVGSPTSSSASPKKFMGALTQMSIGIGDREREMRFRREQEYQKQLRDQIEEKKRKKDEEKRGDDKTKQKEMREYLTGHYKGEIPERLKSILVVDGDNSDGDVEHQQYQQYQQQPQQYQQMGRDRKANSRGTLQSPISHKDDPREMRNGNGDGNYSGDDYINDIRSESQAKKLHNDDGMDEYHGRNSSNGRRVENNQRTKNSVEDRRGVSRNEHSTAVDDDPQSPAGNRVARQGNSYRGDKNDKNDRGDMSGNGRVHQFQDRNGRWISEVEYGELTTLCDRLMTQQDQLQLELKHQAELIKDLQRKPQSSSSSSQGRSKGAENGTHSAHDVTVSGAGASRSKSVQHTRAGASSSSGNSHGNGNCNSQSHGNGKSNDNSHSHGSGNGSRAGGGGKGDQSRRPISNDFRGERERDRDRDRDRDRNGDDYGSHVKEQPSKPQPKTAFGGSILSAPRNMFSKVSKESVAPGSLGTKGASTSASIKKTFLGLAFGGRASSVSKERKGKGEQEGVGGKDKKAATAAAALRGPIATPYDSDDAYMSSRGGSRRGSDPKRYGVRTGGSSQDSTGSAGMELNGQSEYLRMDKVGQDVMSEDQLERLLVQAKSVRSTSARHTMR